MKKFSEFRNKLTAKQAVNYSLIVSTILTLSIAILLTILFWPIHEVASLFMTGLMSPIIFAIFFIISCFFIFDAQKKSFEEKHKSAKQRVIANFGLNTKTRTRVNYKFEEAIEDGRDKELLVKLLTIPEYKFYLRLTEGNTVEIIVTDKDNYIVHVDTVANFIYIEANFEKIA